MDFDAAVHTEGGTFTEQFTTDLPAILGEDFKGGDMRQFCGDNVASLIKNATQTKQAYNTKLENVIQRPGDKATDEEKSTFQAIMRTEAGLDAPKDVAGYEFAKPEMPKGLEYKEEAATAFKQFCLENKIPASLANVLHDMRLNEIIGTHNAAIEAKQKAFDTSVETLKTDWPGDELPVNLRCAHDALMQFGSDDLVHNGETFKGLKTLLKEADLYTAPDNFEKWQGLQIAPDQLRLWANIGKRMQSGDIQIGSKAGQSKEEKDKAGHNDFVKAVGKYTTY